MAVRHRVALQDEIEHTMTALRSCGVLGFDSRRGPEAADWLLVAAGDDLLIPVRTTLTSDAECLGVVVRADPPPTDRAVLLLHQLASGDVPGPDGAGESAAGDDRVWALVTAARVVAAVRARGSSGAI